MGWMEAAGARLHKVQVIDVKERVGKKWERRPMYDLIEDLDTLEQAIQKIGDVQLIIFDPITALMGDRNSNSNTEVRHFLAPLSELAAKYDLAIVGISHLNKKSEVRAAYRTLGSIAFVAAARAVWLVAPDADADDEDKRLLLPAKGNLSRNPTGLAFRLVDVEIQTDKGPMTSVRCEFERGEVHRTADEALSANNKGTRTPSAVERAKDWLQQQLSSGPKAAKIIMNRRKKCGIPEKTLYRAKDELGVRSHQDHSGKTMKWMWELPE